ncbi:hypothetical protein HDU87_003601 [Geranomyces variabilis]|uniref:Uncharacterized protein n=1 Tax=Geranomyces variabilis TaxID=109894 RepID=A0AAD5TLS1_9FUNG|nr:hypothetical protein HDU87_003601 [Geranomyces variabilis]
MVELSEILSPERAAREHPLSPLISLQDLGSSHGDQLVGPILSPPEFPPEFLTPYAGLDSEEFATPYDDFLTSGNSTPQPEALLRVHTPPPLAPPAPHSAPTSTDDNDNDNGDGDGDEDEDEIDDEEDQPLRKRIRKRTAQPAAAPAKPAQQRGLRSYFQPAHAIAEDGDTDDSELDRRRWLQRRQQPLARQPPSVLVDDQPQEAPARTKAHAAFQPLRTATAQTARKSPDTQPPRKGQMRARTSAHQLPRGEASLEPLLIPTYFEMRQGRGANFKKVPPQETPAFSVNYWWAEQNTMIVLCTDVPSEEHVFEEDTLYSKTCVPLLLSHLRIAIRARNSPLASHTAFELMKLDLLALLRELIVIVLEEAVPNPLFPVFTWLVCAMQEGYRPPWTLTDWLMGLVLSAATCTFQDQASDTTTTTPIILVCKTIAELPHAKRDLLYAIQLAKSQLPATKKQHLDALTRMWIHRMSSDPHQTIYSRSCSNVPHASSANWALEYDAWNTSAVTPQCTDIVDVIRHDMTPAHQSKWPDDTVIKMAIARHAVPKNTRYLIATGARATAARGDPDDADEFWWRYGTAVANRQQAWLKSFLRSHRRRG